MKKFLLLGALAGLCGCGRVDRTPIIPMDSAPPASTYGAVPAEAKVTPTPPSPPPPADYNTSPPRGEDDDLSGGTGRRRWGSAAEAMNSVNGQLEDVYFSYDQFELSPQATAALQKDAGLLREILREFPQLQVTVEGHCDDRGSAEYNLGLGDRRSRRTIATLAQLGLPEGNFKPLSYGKEAPQCTASNESCWSRNRRAHFVVRTAATE